MSNSIAQAVNLLKQENVRSTEVLVVGDEAQFEQVILNLFLIYLLNQNTSLGLLCLNLHK